MRQKQNKSAFAHLIAKMDEKQPPRKPRVPGSLTNDEDSSGSSSNTPNIPTQNAIPSMSGGGSSGGGGHES